MNCLETSLPSHPIPSHLLLEFFLSSWKQTKQTNACTHSLTHCLSVRSSVRSFVRSFVRSVAFALGIGTSHYAGPDVRVAVTENAVRVTREEQVVVEDGGGGGGAERLKIVMVGRW